MSYLQSSQIKCYPTAFRDHSKDPESYLNTEKNITNAKILSDSVVSYVTEYPSNTINIYIQGYHFQVAKSVLGALGKPLYAYIKLVTESSYYNGNDVYQNTRLDNYETTKASLDVGGSFQGYILQIQKLMVELVYKFLIMKEIFQQCQKLKLEQKKFKIVLMNL